VTACFDVWSWNEYLTTVLYFSTQAGAFYAGRARDLQIATGLLQCFYVKDTQTLDQIMLVSYITFLVSEHLCVYFTHSRVCLYWKRYFLTSFMNLWIYSLMNSISHYCCHYTETQSKYFGSPESSTVTQKYLNF
jgi:hypothetical protein